MDRINKFPWWKGEGFGSPFFYLCSEAWGSDRRFKTKDSQARFRFVKFFRVAEMSHSVTYMSQSNNKI